MGRHRREHQALVDLRDLLELATGRPRLLDLARRERDLDVGGKQRGAFERLRDPRARSANRGERRVAPPVREPKLREPRLRLPAETARFPVRLLRRVESPLKPQDLSLAVAREAGRGVLRLEEPPAGAARLLERVEPGTAQLQDLRAMDEAAAGESDEIALLLDPFRQGERPLPRASHLEDLLAREDDSAVDDADDERGQLSRRHRDHRLVEQRQAFAYAPASYEHVALGVQSHREQVAVAEPLADASGLAGDGRGGFELRGGFVLEDDRNQQIAVLSRFLRFLVEEPLCSSQPAARRAHRTPIGEVHPDPRRGAHRAQRLAPLQVLVVGSLEDSDALVVAPKHPGRGREQLEILRSQRRDRVSSGERLDRLEPRATLVGSTALLELVACRHHEHSGAKGPRFPGALPAYLVPVFRR